MSVSRHLCRQNKISETVYRLTRDGYSNGNLFLTGTVTGITVQVFGVVRGGPSRDRWNV